MNQKGFMNLAMVGVVVAIFAVAGYFIFSNKKVPDIQDDVAIAPTTCKDEQEGTPVITSLSSYSGSVGSKLEIIGCNFAGFEGDKNAWIENSQGIKGILYGEAGSSEKLLKLTLKSPLCRKDTSYSGLPCDETLTLIPGSYKIYVFPWGKESNKVNFTIQ